jgi:hypothetical protein
MADDNANSEQHTTSLALWDLVSPLITNRAAKMKVGAKCSAGCRLTDHEIEVRDFRGASVAGAKLSAEPWPGTTGLYWAELEFRAPSNTGTHTWTITSLHGEALSSFTFITVRPPEHALTITVHEQGTEVPLADVEVRLGVYRATTDGSGSATVELPAGSYGLSVWKVGYENSSQAIEITSTRTIHVEIAPEPELEQPYWM